MSNFAPRPSTASLPDPQLERALRIALVAGLLLIVLLPMARGSSAWLGWMPMWLAGMPAVALWSLHRFRLPWPRARAGAAARGLPRRRRSGAQARRRAMPATRQLPRAA
ncbi:hypothetical protein DT603_13545 [Pseudoxanthomonas gei]|uniref:Transmembrane protein n=1 Tax=Pseudoxanthomonas gei TaxID=1383030 RepID=A0ABX0AH05_9GAMM|nr:hypothetical protein [Pseudoxanthomonas gei]NDK39862.1 hypothetical protein [Pseudoxanthomonas gei]